jgi:uncharacterized protein
LVGRSVASRLPLLPTKKSADRHPLVVNGLRLALTLVLGACGAKPATPQGFARVGLTVGDKPVCAWLADTEALRDRGLMDVTSLGKADAMVFRFPEPTDVAFYMYKTKLALTVVFVSAAGLVSDIVDMEPCPETEATKCPLFRSRERYLTAIEVAQGKAVALGFSVGATVETRPNC